MFQTAESFESAWLEAARAFLAIALGAKTG
jgi:hypothetical protein